MAVRFNLMSLLIAMVVVSLILATYQMFGAQGGYLEERLLTGWYFGGLVVAGLASFNTCGRRRSFWLAYSCYGWFHLLTMVRFDSLLLGDVLAMGVFNSAITGLVATLFPVRERPVRRAGSGAAIDGAAEMDNGPLGNGD